MSNAPHVVVRPPMLALGHEADAVRKKKGTRAMVTTGNGEVTVRPISPADAELMQSFVTGLSGTSRYFRFFQALKSLSPGMLNRLTRVDQVGHVALAGVARLGGRASMVAEARYAVGSDGTTAEIALAVADQWQRRGIATELLTTLEHIAAAAGIRHLIGECLAVNEPFVGLVRTLGYRVYPDVRDCRLLQIEKYLDEGAQSRGVTYLRESGATVIDTAMGW